ncbi:nuclease SbcCD subunit C [Shewanella hanedai]|uniref:Nuclease SbcCD subunit C n=1 Tax=Shewanella hanedai TaxID=25 RepID=A0A553JJ45_SHEHA|nr:SMC family ATPase [Shewanella hanedai]TRY12466.1 SMC family ATPase [Shewanella hanedai]GGI96560.1 nuclease SbcCD subunit C [Shewanella hanedai]
MRPLILNMSAFGPFASTQEVDFSALGTNPLFLINGPTGAGKTTILDAICFALYGKTTGDEREGSQMRCDVADDNLLTEVTFSFSLGDMQYRIRRVPEQDRAKKSGEGFTVQKPEAQLYRIDKDGTEHLLVASKVSEATAEIELLTGLDADQFRQVMVLPQGKFRELLMADSKDREKIFSQLFQTQIYRKIEDKLKLQASAIRNEVRDGRNKRDGILQSVELGSDEALTAELTEISPKLASASESKELATSALIEINKQFESAKVLISDFEQEGKLKQVAASLAAQKEGVVQSQVRLDNAQKAEQVKPVYDQLLAREAEATQAQVNVTQMTSAKTAAEEKLALCQTQFAALSELDQVLHQAQSEEQALTQLEPQLQGLDRLQKEVQISNIGLNQAKERGVQAKGNLDKLLADKLAAEQQLPLLERQAAELMDVQQALTTHSDIIERYQQWQVAIGEVEKTTLGLAHAKDKGQLLREGFKESQTSHRQLQLIWHRGQSASLAQQLSLGEPCPVCGSEEHPNPAQSEQLLPTEDELQSAQRNEELANEALSQARAEYSSLMTKLQEQTRVRDEYQQKLGDCALQTFESLQSHQQQLKQQVQGANAATQQLAKLRQELQAWQVKEQDLRVQLEAERERYHDIQTRTASLQGQLDQALASIPEQYRSLEILTAAITQIQGRVTDYLQQIQNVRQTHSHAVEQDAACGASLQAAQLSLTQAQAQRENAQSTLVSKLETSGFSDKDALIQSLLSNDESKSLADDIAKYAQECAANQATLSQLSDKLSHQVKPELPVIEATLKSTQLQQREAEQLWQGLHARVTQLTQTQKQLKDADAQAKKLEDEYAIIGTLADVANGQTGNKISLQRFVLSVLLDDVLLEASHRLQLMSKGRYRLIRKEDRSKGNKASGLELEVEDAYTSKVRPVATLSGGESFMAALSMALGLSDVVQAYAGGIKLDTLFIDEGFGSLDQDSLDLAIRTLMDLQSAGRMIGVISHVSEMKEQIGTRIDIIKTANGSKTVIVLP